MKDFRIEVTLGETTVSNVIQAVDWNSAKEEAHIMYPGFALGEILEIAE